MQICKMVLGTYMLTASLWRQRNGVCTSRANCRGQTILFARRTVNRVKNVFIASKSCVITTQDMPICVRPVTTSFKAIVYE